MYRRSADFVSLEKVDLSMNMSEKSSTNTAREILKTAFQSHPARRTLLKSTIAGISGLTLLSAGALVPVEARSGGLSRDQADAIVTILSVARTAEQLAVTFYSNALANAAQLGLNSSALEYLNAALIEEQIHQLFLAANGGTSLAENFSFPSGSATFTDLHTFVSTQQQLEGVFDSAYLAAVKELAILGRPDLAQVAGQIACVESEHRVLGRVIGGLQPANNWAFVPVSLGQVSDAPALIQKAGYLSPVSGNSYYYKPVSIASPGIEQLKPFAASSPVMGRG